MIGRALADKLNLHLGDRITLEGDIFPVTLELTVRGHLTTRRRTTRSSTSTASIWTRALWREAMEGKSECSYVLADSAGIGAAHRASRRR